MAESRRPDGICWIVKRDCEYLIQNTTSQKIDILGAFSGTVHSGFANKTGRALSNPNMTFATRVLERSTIRQTRVMS